VWRLCARRRADVGAAQSVHLIGGVAGEFYQLVAAHYNQTAPPFYNHEPHVAARAFGRLLNASTNITLVRGGHAANIASAEREAHGRLRSITLADGRVVTGGVFVDASYEGDLLARSGASWTVGREAPADFNESCAGRRPDDFNGGYEFKVRVDPFDGAGQPLPLLARGHVGVPGQRDGRVQAYNFRLCATADGAEGAAAPFPPPDPSSRFARPETWELARRLFRDPNWATLISRGGCPGSDFPCFDKESPPLNPRTGHKRDWNNPFLGPLNTDCVTGCNQSGYVGADLAGKRHADCDPAVNAPRVGAQTGCGVRRRLVLCAWPRRARRAPN